MMTMYKTTSSKPGRVAAGMEAVPIDRLLPSERSLLEQLDLLSSEPWATVADTGVLATHAIVPIVDDRDGEIAIANERFARSLGLL
jgi:hypothetical protein